MPKPYALVTGASSGIGVEIARNLAARGYPLILVARRRDRLVDLQTQITQAHGVDVVVIDQDLAQEGAAQQLYDRVQQQNLRVGVLVNNAGVGMQGKFLDMEMARIARMFTLNMTSLTHLTQLFARDMVTAKGGHILQVASAAAFLPTPYVAAYAATKSYVLAFSEALRFELRGTGVSLTTLYPGITTTEFNEHAEAKTPSAMALSILSAHQVADIAVEAMLAGRRAIVPGWINKINAFFSSVLPRGLVIFFAGLLMKKANSQ
jgi:short-subunit dehydrogenase